MDGHVNIFLRHVAPASDIQMIGSICLTATGAPWPCCKVSWKLLITSLFSKVTLQKFSSRKTLDKANEGYHTEDSRRRSA